MQHSSGIINYFLKFSLVTTSFTFIMPGCKKIKDFATYEAKISFTYNGQQHNLTSPSRIQTDLIIVQNQLLFVNFAGLVIDNQNLFGGTVYINTKTPGPIRCAFLLPPGKNVNDVLGDCRNLQSNGGPIDSVNVYYYESGSVNFIYTDCRPVSGAIVPGQKDCSVSGNFDLTLTNKNNLKIKLINGSFSGRIRTYP